MATSVTQSLFGITPQSIQNERDTALQQQALQFAKLDPFQAARMGLFQGASQLGTGIAGALGYEDPEIAQARQRQGMLGGLDIGDPKALRTAAANADPQTASLLVTRAMELEKGSADIGAAQALANQRNREADPVQELAKTGKYTTASLGKYAQSRDVNDLVLTENLTQTEIEKLQIYRDTLTDPKKIAEVDKVIEGVQKGKGTNVTVGGAVDTTVKAFEVADADSLKNLRTAASAASGQLGFIQQARDQVQNSAVAGTGVPSVVRGLNTFLAPLGINADQVAKTRNLEQALNSIIAQGIKQYGANPSTADLEFAKRASASITDPKQAIVETLNYLEERAQALLNKSTAADKYLLTNKNLGGFEQFWANQQRNANNPASPSGVRKTKSGVNYTVVPQN
jgi:hypothetical protein